MRGKLFLCVILGKLNVNQQLRPSIPLKKLLLVEQVKMTCINATIAKYTAQIRMWSKRQNCHIKIEGEILPAHGSNDISGKDQERTVSYALTMTPHVK